MKKFKKAGLIFLLLFILICQSYSSLLPVDDKIDENEAAKEAFKSLVHTAHPLPDKDMKSKNFPLPLAEPERLSIFLNANMIEPETDVNRMQNESSIAVNPKNPNMLIGSAVDYRDNSSTWVYFSEDGGKSWVNFNLGKAITNWRTSNDPSVAYGPNGNAYLVYGGFPDDDSTYPAESLGKNGVFISISTNGGKTWELENTHIPVFVHNGIMTMDSLFEDKYYISVDNSSSSPYLNHLYIPWKRVTPRDSATQIVITKSIDLGRTWSPPISVSPRKPGSSMDTTYGQSFPLASTGPNGEVYVVWNDGIVHGVGFAKSLDGGTTFTNPRIIKNYNIFGITNNISKSQTNPDWKHTVKTKVRAEAYPVLVVDTTSSPRRGSLYLTWAADAYPNIYFSKSVDQGETWSEPLIIHSDTTNDQFWQWMAVDPMNGDIAVMYLDSRDDENNIMVECYVSYSSDGGEAWVDRKISDFNSDIRRNPFNNNGFAGDYSGMAYYYGKIYPSWVDMRNAEKDIYDSDVFTSIINASAPMPVDSFDAKTIPALPEEIELSWKAPTERSFGQDLLPSNYHYLLVTEKGEITVPSEQTTYLDTGLTPYKKYPYKIYVVAGNDTSHYRSDSAYAGGSQELEAPEILFAKGSSSNEIDFEVSLPAFRADMTTKLVNLSKIALFNASDELLTEVNVNAQEAGNKISFKYNPGERGYYDFYIKAFDDNTVPNESGKSNIVGLYTGEINDSWSDDFDAGMQHYRKIKNWNTTSTFFRSAPNSLYDSSSGYQSKMVDSYIEIFPVRHTIENELFLEFWHAALITKRDSAKVEMSTDDGISWSSIAGFHQKDYSYWNDAVLDEQDWKYEKIKLEVIDEDTVQVRFSIVARFGSNNSHWFIDDLNIYNSPVSVEDSERQKQVIIYPNPANNILNVYIGNIIDVDFSQIKIYSALGNEMELQEQRVNGNSLQLDITTLSQGVYYISIFKGGKAERMKFVKINN